MMLSDEDGQFGTEYLWTEWKNGRENINFHKRIKITEVYHITTQSKLSNKNNIVEVCREES